MMNPINSINSNMFINPMAAAIEKEMMVDNIIAYIYNELGTPIDSQMIAQNRPNLLNNISNMLTNFLTGSSNSSNSEVVKPIVQPTCLKKTKMRPSGTGTVTVVQNSPQKSGTIKAEAEEQEVEGPIII